MRGAGFAGRELRGENIEVKILSQKTVYQIIKKMIILKSRIPNLEPRIPNSEFRITHPETQSLANINYTITTNIY